MLLMLSVIFSGCEFKDLTLNRVEGFEIEEMNKGSVKGTISVNITNPNSFAITVSGAEFEFFSSQMSLGKARLDQSIKIAANSTQVYPVKFDGNLGNLLAGGISGVIGALSGKNPEATIKGNLKARAFFISKTIPVELKTEIPLDSFRR